jgi:GT2 family glycosyltransferase
MTDAKICVIIVTYKERIAFVNEVSKAAFDQGAAQIIVVSNGTPQKSLKNLTRDSRIELVDLKENFGSSIGYKEGIKKALETNCDFFFLLDDDNLPAPNCLSTLKDNWAKQVLEVDKDKLMLNCYRQDQYENGHLRITDDKLSLQPFNNSCHGFHIRNFFSTLAKRLSGSSEQKSLKDFEPGQLLELDGAFYGGMYFHRRLLDHVPLPDDPYFVYADDLDFSHRVTMAKGKILLVLEAVLESLDCSIPTQNRRKMLYHSTLDYNEPFRTYYCSRNLEYLTRKYFVTNKSIYYLNVFIFFCVIGTVSLLRGKMDRFKLIVLGKIDSWTGKMGKTKRLSGL